MDIYTLEGRRIKSIPTDYFSIGYHRIAWDGRDEYGGLLANGVYIYKMTAADGVQTINHIGKWVGKIEYMKEAQFFGFQQV